MRSCRHCAHENADHLAFCSQCGRKLPRTDSALTAAIVRPISNSDPGMAFLRTVMATPNPSSTTGRAMAGRNVSGRLTAAEMAVAPARPRSRVRWLGESVAYIYVYLRGKLDAGERRRRLSEERTGAEA